MSRVAVEVASAFRDVTPTERLVVAVSGGADSVSLLRAVADLLPGQAVVAHVNHQLRGLASDDDEAFVRDLALGLGLEFRGTRIEIVAMAARDGDNLEAAARRERYRFFASIAAEVGAGWVATGHTAGDQAETVLHRIIRGTGLRGLRGIGSGNVHLAAVAADQNQGAIGSPSPIGVLRPLLRVTRSELLEYLAELSQPFREDESNSDVRFTRNRIRHELLPLLERFNPRVGAALVRLADQADELYAVLEAEARGLLERSERPRAGGTLVFEAGLLTPGADFGRAHIFREMLRIVWDREGWPSGAMTFAHWDRVVAVATGSVAAVELPDGVRARRVGGVLQLNRVARN